MGKSAGEILNLLRGIRTTVTNHPKIATDATKKVTTHVAQAREALVKQGPSWWTRFTNPDAYFRYQASMDTFDTATNTTRHKEMMQQAKANLKRWSQETVKPDTHEVKVTSEDWSVASLQLAKDTGKMPAVLTNGSAEIPGGGYPNLSAQEEELFRTTTAPKYLVNAFVPPKKGASQRLHHNVEQNTFRYTPAERRLIIGATPMTDEELEILSQLRGHKVDQANKIYIHGKPLICFKGPDTRLAVDDPNAYPQAMGSGYILEHSYSYQALPPEDVYAFRDIVAAAPNLADGAITRPQHDGGGDIPTDWNDPVFLEAYNKDMKRRVGATLDTCILNGERNPVLTALGCGAYLNHPKHVAEIFRDELYKRPGVFDNVVFPIKVAPGLEPVNHTIFKDVLDGMPLHQTGEQFSFFSPKKETETTVHSDTVDKTHGI